MKQIFHSKIHERDKLYGTATIGAKGQVVIPAEARKDLKLKPGDQLLVMGKMDKALGLIKAEELEGFIETMMKTITGLGVKEEIKRHIKRLVKKAKDLK
jgi:AbrB family looped-hinge helix DNA binding protein